MQRPTNSAHLAVADQPTLSALRPRAVFQIVCVILFSSFLIACKSGAPLVVNQNPADQVLALDCKNIQAKQAITEFRVDNYLTTGGAVFGEVWASEYSSADIGAGGLNVMAKMPQKETYCMRYDASMDAVNTAVAEALKTAGLLLVSNPDHVGGFETDWAYRTPTSDVAANLFPHLKWREKYFVFVSKNLVAGTDARVYRDIEIAREPADSEEERQYNQSKSIGHNEAWILLTVQEMVGHQFTSTTAQSRMQSP